MVHLQFFNILVLIRKKGSALRGGLLSARAESNQRAAKGWSQSAGPAAPPLPPCRPPPGPPFYGVTPWARQKISGAQNLSGWSKFPPAHWGLFRWKILAGAVPYLRLVLPNQRSGSVFRCLGDPCGRPNAFPFRGHLSPGGRLKKSRRRPPKKIA